MERGIEKRGIENGKLNNSPSKIRQTGTSKGVTVTAGKKKRKERSDSGSDLSDITWFKDLIKNDHKELFNMAGITETSKEIDDSAFFIRLLISDKLGEAIKSNSFKSADCPKFRIINSHVVENGLGVEKIEKGIKTIISSLTAKFTKDFNECFNRLFQSVHKDYDGQSLEKKKGALPAVRYISLIYRLTLILMKLDLYSNLINEKPDHNANAAKTYQNTQKQYSRLVQDYLEFATQGEVTSRCAPNNSSQPVEVLQKRTMLFTNNINTLLRNINCKCQPTTAPALLLLARTSTSTSALVSASARVSVSVSDYDSMADTSNKTDSQKSTVSNSSTSLDLMPTSERPEKKLKLDHILN